MNKTKPIQKKEVINLNTAIVANRETGEEIELPQNGKFVSFEQTDKTKITTTNFVSIDLDEIHNIIKHNTKNMLDLKNCLGILFVMTEYLQYTTNSFVLENKKALSASNLAKQIGLSQRTIKNTLHKLEELNIIKEIPNQFNEAKGKKIYIANPFLLKKGVEFYSNILSYFDNHSKNTLINNRPKD